MTEIATSVEQQDDLQKILAALADSRRKLPIDAIQAARRNKERIIPELIRVLRGETQAVREQGKSPGTAFFAFFLLAEFRAKEGLPAIIEAISLPGDGPFELFGDAVHDVLPRVLVSLGGDQCVDVCSALVRNPAVNEYVRWSSAKAIVYLAMAGLKPRAEIVNVCRELLRDAIRTKDEHAVTGMIMSMLDMNPWEAADEFEAAFRLRLMDEGMISWDEAKECLTKEPIGVSHEYRDPPRIDDTIGELHTWASFREPEPRTSKPHWPEPPFPAPAPKRASPSRPATPTAVAPFQSRDRVGRNDPCPCGSGKKFKRCCGGRRGTAN